MNVFPVHGRDGTVERSLVAMVAGAVKLNVSHWLLERKLYRPTFTDVAIALSRTVLIRVYAAAVCLVSMLLAAWIGAVARALTADRWHVFRTLDGVTLLSAARHAGAYQAGLLPVLLVWAALLTVTPTGFTIAFRAALVAAGALGYLRFSPPSFAMTDKVTSVSHWLARFDNYCSRSATLFLVVSIAAAYVSMSSAVGMFGRLHAKALRVPSDGFARTLCAVLLALLVLLLAGWAATVVRLGGSLDAGRQGGGYQSSYLLVLALLAVFVTHVSDSGRWLTAAVVLVSLYALAPDAFTVPAVMRYAVGSGLFTGIGNAWGASALWAALFLYVPASLLGIYLVGRLRS